MHGGARQRRLYRPARMIAPTRGHGEEVVYAGKAANSFRIGDHAANADARPATHCGASQRLCYGPAAAQSWQDSFCAYGCPGPEALTTHHWSVPTLGAGDAHSNSLILR